MPIFFIFSSTCMYCFEFGKLVRAISKMCMAFWEEPLFILFSFFQLYFPTCQLCKTQRQHHYRAVGASGATSAIVFSFIVLNPLPCWAVFLVPIFPAAIWHTLFGLFKLGKQKVLTTSTMMLTFMGPSPVSVLRLPWNLPYFGFYKIASSF